jgi:hypothetical protein
MLSSINEGAQVSTLSQIKSLMQDCENSIPNIDMKKLFSAGAKKDGADGNSGYLMPDQQDLL